MRSLTKPNDPLYPKVRRLHLKIWAKGTIESRNIGIVAFCALWLCTNIATFVFFLGWRILAVMLALYAIDLIHPGYVACLIYGFFGIEKFIGMLSRCSLHENDSLYLMRILFLFLFIFLVTFPQKKFAQKVGEVIFMILNIVLFGVPLKLIAIFVDKSSEIFDGWIDRSHTLGPVTTAMVGIFPQPYQLHSDYLWNAYLTSNKARGVGDLEQIIAELESIYLAS